jgi:hypothetical protein
MIVERYYAGWSFERIGAFEFDVTNDADGEAYSVDFSTGSYYHGLLADTAAGFSHSAFETAFENALNAAATAATSAVTWSVAWNNATLRYSITPSSATSTTLVLNTVAQNILGMGSAPSFTNGVTTGTRTPYYVIAPHHRATSNNSGDVHVRGQIKSRITNGGKQFGVGPTTRATLHSWIQKHEPRSAAFIWDGGTAWTFEHLFEHCGVWEPLLLCVDDSTAFIEATAGEVSMRVHLYGPDADFVPVMTFANYDGKWDIPFTTVVTYRW